MSLAIAVAILKRGDYNLEIVATNGLKLACAIFIEGN
jgi:hypothetical protein